MAARENLWLQIIEVDMVGGVTQQSIDCDRKSFDLHSMQISKRFRHLDTFAKWYGVVYHVRQLPVNSTFSN